MDFGIWFRTRYADIIAFDQQQNSCRHTAVTYPWNREQLFSDIGNLDFAMARVKEHLAGMFSCSSTPLLFVLPATSHFRESVAVRDACVRSGLAFGRTVSEATAAACLLVRNRPENHTDDFSFVVAADIDGSFDLSGFRYSDGVLDAELALSELSDPVYVYSWGNGKQIQSCNAAVVAKAMASPDLYASISLHQFPEVMEAYLRYYFEKPTDLTILHALRSSLELSLGQQKIPLLETGTCYPAIKRFPAKLSGRTEVCERVRGQLHAVGFCLPPAIDTQSGFSEFSINANGILRLNNTDILPIRIAKSSAETAGDLSPEHIRELMAILDHLMHASQYTDGVPEAYTRGISSIFPEPESFLMHQEVCPIGKVGEPFDPEIHDAMFHVDDGSFPENTVTEVIRLGYTFRGKLILPASVTVAN